MKVVDTVILNWNGLDDTLRCLESLRDARNAVISTRTILIDNGSKIDPVDEIKRIFPDVDYVRLDKNIGYAAACNLGARRALSRGADFILFLNNDTVVEPNLVALLAESFDINGNLAAVSPLIHRTDPSPQVEFTGGVINYALGRFTTRGLPSSKDESLQLCDYASGCCMLISRQALEQVGLLDETFFAYFEDTDFSVRCREQGLQIACRLDASIIHKGFRGDASESHIGNSQPAQALSHFSQSSTVDQKACPFLVAYFFPYSRTAFNYRLLSHRLCDSRATNKSARVLGRNLRWFLQRPADTKD